MPGLMIKRVLIVSRGEIGELDPQTGGIFTSGLEGRFKLKCGIPSFQDASMYMGAESGMPSAMTDSDFQDWFFI